MSNEWSPSVGDECYKIIHGWGAPTLFGPHRVTRVTKTQFALDDGTRWRMRSRTRLGRSEWSSEGIYSATGPEVAEAKAAQARQDARHAVREAFEQWWRGAGATSVLAEAAAAFRDKHGEECGR